MCGWLSPKKWRPTWVAAFVLVLVALAGVGVYEEGWLKAWMPNVVVGAITVAVTITLIDRIIRAEVKQSNKSRLDDALDAISYPFRGLFFGIAFDYGQTHSSLGTLPDDPLDLLDFWLAQDRTRDSDRLLTRGASSTMLMWETSELNATLTKHRELNRDVFDSGLLRAIDRFNDAEKNSSAVSELLPAGLPDPQRHIADAHEAIVKAAKLLATEYTKVRADWNPIDEFTYGAAEVGNSSHDEPLNDPAPT